MGEISCEYLVVGPLSGISSMWTISFFVLMHSAVKRMSLAIIPDSSRAVYGASPPCHPKMVAGRSSHSMLMETANPCGSY
jgi:hypothetical protein